MSFHLKRKLFLLTGLNNALATQTAAVIPTRIQLIHSCKGYKAALSVSVFHTMGNICCIEDTMGLGKFFTNAVTAWWKRRRNADLKSFSKLLKTNYLIFEIKQLQTILLSPPQINISIHGLILLRATLSKLLNDFLVSHLEDFHLETAIRRGSIRHLQSLHKCFRELLHYREDQCLGRTLHI